MSMIGVLLGIIGIYLLISQKQVMDQENSLLGRLYDISLYA